MTKRVSSGTDSRTSNSTKRGKATRKRRVDYPKYTVDEALEIAEAIHTSLKAKQAAPGDVAQACGSSHGTASWRVRLAASKAYGLTEGSYNAKRIQLAERGLAAVAPRSAEERRTALREAALTPDLLRKVYEAYPQGDFPSDDLFRNVLERDYGVPRDDYEAFVRVLKGNTKYACEGDEGLATKASQEEMAVSSQTQIGLEGPESETAIQPPTQPREGVKVFIGHSKNEGILDVLRTTMQLAGLDFVIAEEEETAAVPIPEKVLELMRGCNAAVINVSADEQSVRSDGSFEINQNVLIEIGAAFVLYPRGVVLVWDKRLQVPSNLQGLSRCEYEGDQLTAEQLLKLQKAITKFRQ